MSCLRRTVIRIVFMACISHLLHPCLRPRCVHLSMGCKRSECNDAIFEHRGALDRFCRQHRQRRARGYFGIGLRQRENGRCYHEHLTIRKRRPDCEKRTYLYPFSSHKKRARHSLRIVETHSNMSVKRDFTRLFDTKKYTLWIVICIFRKSLSNFQSKVIYKFFRITFFNIHRLLL